MSHHTRYAIYDLPRPGALARFGAGWLGWDVQSASAVRQPDIDGITALTDRPRRYGFHATLKPPFRLAQDQTCDALTTAVAALAARTAPAQTDGLTLTRLGRFFALTPVGRTDGIDRIAAACVTELDPLRASAPPSETAARRKPGLSPRQEALLAVWGYPHVLDQFRYHMTLTGRIDTEHLDKVEALIRRNMPPLPVPFVVRDICLCGERPDGRFELLERFPLTG